MKQLIITLRGGLKLYATLTGGLLCFLAGQVGSSATSSPFSRILVFADSLSHTGNLHAPSGGALPPYGSRFSNGKLWIEYLADHLGMQLQADNTYAVGGAKTGHRYLNDGAAGQEYPGLLDQVGGFLTSLQPGRADPDALYIVWAGAYDFLLPLSPEELIRNGVGNTTQAVQLLRLAGARRIVVPNAPDLGLTP